MASEAPAIRRRVLNDHAPQDGPVVYWMTSARRTTWHHGLEHAVARAQARDAPLLVLEALRADHPYASDRFHRFVIDGMHDHADACRAGGVAYHPFVEPAPGAGNGLLRALAPHVGLIVADDHPGFFFPKMLAAAGNLPVRVEAIDSNGVLPLAAAPGTFASAYAFRRFLHKHLPEHLVQRPAQAPLEDAPGGWDPPEPIHDAWPATDLDRIDLAGLPIDHDVTPVDLPGGAIAGTRRLEEFLERIDRYPERSHPDADAPSGLSPYLHFGHVGAAQAAWAVLDAEDWHPGRLGVSKGQRSGWWGLSDGAEAFLDQLITWRELGFIEAHHDPHFDQYDHLPQWARQTLADHADDPRDVNPLADLEAARSPDPLWNAAQRQLLAEGVIHNHLRMLWGKSFLRWAPTPQDAFAWMLHLNDKYALDGRDPNSVSGVAWCLGRYDRGWPEREIFGKVRTMTSQSTGKKRRLDAYMARWGDSGKQ